MDMSPMGGSTPNSREKRMKPQMLATTEKYYIADDEWDVLPALLNTPKQGAALCKFQNRFIYAFGGDSGRSSGGNILSEIERLDLYYEEELTKWELLYIKQKVLSPLAFGQALLVDDHRILIVGGKQNIVSLTKTYLYDVVEGRLSPFTGG